MRRLARNDSAMGDSGTSFYEQLIALEREGTGFVLVVLVEALGSTPQDTGAKMLVTAAGLHTGTVGGGKVEAKALALAQEMLARGSAQPCFARWTLKTDVGMTCGGSVKLYFEPHPAGGAGAAWPIWIFGAGHVVQALVPVLAPLDCQLTVVDPRRDWLDRLPRGRNIRYLQADEPAELVPSMPDNAFLLCLTKGHTSDRPVLQRALAERNFPFVGVIGSDAKAAVLRQEMIAAGLSPEHARQFHCPVGLDFGTNHPHEIALSIAAQLLSERDRLRTDHTNRPQAGLMQLKAR
jgi:xanthine dehydrogenase accessory factor